MPADDPLPWKPPTCTHAIITVYFRGAARGRRNVAARRGILVVDLHTGDAVHWIRFEGRVGEIDDVITLPGARNPSLISFVSDEIRRLISIEEDP